MYIIYYINLKKLNFVFCPFNLTFENLLWENNILGDIFSQFVLVIYHKDEGMVIRGNVEISWDLY